VTPTGRRSAFWQVDPVLAAPGLASGTGPNSDYYIGGVLIGPGDDAALATAYQGAVELVTWFFPVTSTMTAAEVPRLESHLAAYATSPVPRDTEVSMGEANLTSTEVSAGLVQGLASFISQWHTVAQADSLLLVGLFAAGVMLLLICSDLAIEAYRPEIVVMRVRGGSLRQLARRMLIRSCLITVPALAVGAGLAVVVLPAGGSASSWLLGGLTAVAAVACLPVLAVLAHRERSLADLGRRDELVLARPRVRRLIGELAVVLVAGAAVADLRLRGAATTSTGTYLSASIVLIAAVVGLVVNRLYRGPLRAVARVASGLKGPVGVVGLTRAALSRTGSIGPAITLMLTLTLVAFSAMMMAAVAAGQVAASWAQVGADVQVTVPGLTGNRLTGVTPAELHAFSQVKGVRHVAEVYTASSTGNLSVNLSTSGREGPSLGLAVVSPASYGALSADTPWPDFPARALARPHGGPGGRVPVLVTPDVLATARSAASGGGGSGGSSLEFGGLNLPVKIIGTITDTAAMPAGGSYVVLPNWAAPRLPSIPPATTVLLTGSAIDLSQLRSTMSRLLPPRGGAVSIRQQVLSSLVHSPALRLSHNLYILAAIAAAALSALAVLFALASSGRSRIAMMTELAALGMARSQALALGLTDALPLVVVAAVGSAVSGWLLAVLLGPLLGLGVYTDGIVPVTLEPTWLAVLVPIAAAAALAVAFLVLEGLAGTRRHIGALLRFQEAGQT
jgi:putative ABC transport system permease protein